MGKKRVAFLGEETPVVKKKKDKKPEHIRSGKADEHRLTDMGQKALEELEQIQQKEEKVEKEVKKSRPKDDQPRAEKRPKVRSKRYQNIKKNLDLSKKYTPDEALELLENYKLSSFDESVEVHLTAKEKLSASVSLPHGTGKQQKVVIADDKLIDAISDCKIDFDILVAEPKMMPKLAKVAKILGPKGLMPNPKTGTISENPERLALSLSKGQTRFKTEQKVNLIHFSIGKVSFGKEKLAENLKAFITAVKPKNIEKATLCSTMGPGIKLDISSF